MAVEIEIGKQAAVRTNAPLATDPAMVVTLKPGGGAGADVNIAGWFGSVLPTVGQKVMASSIPVVIASDQVAIPITTTPVASSIATRTSVNDTAADVELIGANANRLGLSITNDSSAILYLAAGGAAASTTSYTFQLRQGGFWEPPEGSRFTGAVRGIWASDPNDGAAHITEYTA
jgi:hypothetical protein